jgi:peptide/nickel transport system ATP-binding protein
MLITHDLGVIAEMADSLVVMYSGRVVEKGTVHDVFKNPSHPYTIGLLNSKPALNREVSRTYSIPGKVPNPINCRLLLFPRPVRDENGSVHLPIPTRILDFDTHTVNCYRYAPAGREMSRMPETAGKNDES